MLSVVVNFFNNRREARNTLFALTRAYQRDARDIAYEVVAVDNGSTQPLDEAEVRALGPEFRYRYVATRSVSPVEAINAACRDATGELLLVFIDGAHMPSPGVFRATLDAYRLFPRLFAAMVSFHLGPTLQNRSVLEGYNQHVEDELLRRAGWKENGYRLYNASGGYGDGGNGWFGCPYESSVFGIRKADYLAMGGFDERFQCRGGGLANLDFFRRALSRQDLQYAMLLGEGTFHQFHGGVASNATQTVHPWDEFEEEYQRIRGQRFQRLPRQPFLMGKVPKEALLIAKESAENGLEFWQKYYQAVGEIGTSA